MTVSTTLQETLLNGMSLGQLYQLGQSPNYARQLQEVAFWGIEAAANESIVVPVGWPTAGWQGRENAEGTELHYLVRLGFGTRVIDLEHPLLALAWQAAHIDPRLTVVSAIIDERIREGIEREAWLQPPDTASIMRWMADPKLRAFRVVELADAERVLGDLYCAPGPRTPKLVNMKGVLMIADAPQSITIDEPLSRILAHAVGSTIGELINFAHEHVRPSPEHDPAEIKNGIARLVITSTLVGVATGMIAFVER